MKGRVADPLYHRPSPRWLRGFPRRFFTRIYTFGRVRSALGLEYRRAEIDDTPSINMQTANVYNFSSAAITRGKDSVWEVYGEVEVPVLAGMKFAEELTINVSGRYTDYKSYGGDSTQTHIDIEKLD